MKQAVIDTNVLISWYKTGVVAGNDDLSAVAPIFSIITKLEALGFQHITSSEVRAINNMLGSGELVYINDAVAEQTIYLRQNHKIKTPDAIIAATALTYGAELWTANTSDFANIQGLKLFNPLVIKT